MKNGGGNILIDELWQEHLATPFPRGLRGKDMNGIDFVMFDANIAGCITTFLERGKLNLYQTAILGLSHQRACSVVPVLNEEGAAYFWRLERLAALILKAVALSGSEHNKKSTK
ncbi:MAG TPA: hypothetical protein VF899_21235 [Pyrinomonadaceae bacterium]